MYNALCQGYLDGCITCLEQVRFYVILAIGLRKLCLLKFVGTGEGMLLEYAVLELQKVSPTEENDGKKVQYINNIICSRKCNDREDNLSLLQAIFVSISIWCDNKLQDYHRHFSQVNCCQSVVLLYSFLFFQCKQYPFVYINMSSILFAKFCQSIFVISSPLLNFILI